MADFNSDNAYTTENAMWRDVYDPTDKGVDIFAYSMPAAQWHETAKSDVTPLYVWGFNEDGNNYPVASASLSVGGAVDSQARNAAATAQQSANQALSAKMDNAPATIDLTPAFDSNNGGHLAFHYNGEIDATTTIQEVEAQLEAGDVAIARTGNPLYNRMNITGAKALALVNGMLMLSDTGDVRVEKADDSLQLRPGTTGGVEVRDRFGSTRPTTASQFIGSAASGMLDLETLQTVYPEIYAPLSALKAEAAENLLALEPVMLIDQALLSAPAAEPTEEEQARARRLAGIASALGLQANDPLVLAAAGAQYVLDPAAVAQADPTYACYNAAGEAAGIDYAAMVPTFIAALKGQAAHIASLEARLEALEPQP
ncbi:MAG: hypothetical protein GXY32_08800 [Ruminococcaceae bacterium]|nr:hypothetical protein [Oscillospiraceae bacterium]